MKILQEDLALGNSSKKVEDDEIIENYEEELRISKMRYDVVSSERKEIQEV